MKTCRDRLRELQAEIGWKGEETTDYTKLPTIKVHGDKLGKVKFHSNKNIKYDKRLGHKSNSSKHSNEVSEKDIKKRYDELIATFDEITQWHVITTYTTTEDAVAYMEHVIESLRDMVDVGSPIEDYCGTVDYRATCKMDDQITSLGLWDEWEKYSSKHKIKPSEIRNARKKFIRSYSKRKSTKLKSYKTFEMYDPIFRVSKMDEQQLKNKLKQINAENRDRRDRMLKMIAECFGGGDEYMLKSFKDKTDTMMKRMKHQMNDLCKSLQIVNPINITDTDMETDLSPIDIELKSEKLDL